jgi:fructose-specific phosphotransferase system IIC component
VWRRTKAGAEKIGGVGLSLIVEMAKAYGKQVITEKLGVAACNDDRPDA